MNNILFSILLVVIGLVVGFGLSFLITESLLLISVFTIVSTASFCPIISFFNSLSNLLSFVISSSFTIFVGIPVLSANTFQISFSSLILSSPE